MQKEDSNQNMIDPCYTTKTLTDEDVFSRSKEENSAVMSKYSFTQEALGQGAYASVYKGYLKSNPEQVVAIKTIKILKKPGFSEKLRREMSILMKFDHPNIVKLYDVAIMEEKVFLFLEFCEGGDLNNKLIQSGNILAESEVMPIFKQLLEAMKELYKNNIIHRDLKPANILLQNNVVKLTDFGFAREVFTGMYEAFEFTRLGTPIYMSPQILNSIPFSTKTDIWSLGIMIYEMLYGKTPWSGNTPQGLLQHILKTPLKFPEPVNKNINGYSNGLVKKISPLSNEIKELLKKMLEVTEEKRISWEEIFEHPIFNEKKDIEGQNFVNAVAQKEEAEEKKENENIPVKNQENINLAKEEPKKINSKEKIEILGEIRPSEQQKQTKKNRGVISQSNEQKEKKKGFLSMFCCNP